MDNKSEISGRAKLKDIFSNGHMVTAGDFASLIDSSVNEADDKLLRKTLVDTGDSICIASGSIGSLLSFLKDLDQDEANWVLRMNQSDGALEFRVPKGLDPVIRLNTNGRVGIGTDRPEADIHVNGKLKADTLELKEALTVQDMAVKGTLTVSKLLIDGVAFTPGGAGNGGGSAEGADKGKDDGSGKGAGAEAGAGDGAGGGSGAGAGSGAGTGAGGAGTGTGVGAGAGSGDVTGKNTQTQNENVVTGTAGSAQTKITAGASVSGTAPADGEWHTIASQGVTSGAANIQSYELMAMVKELDNGCIIRAEAVNIDGDASSNAITETISYSGSTKAKISLRWYSRKAGIVSLQVRTNSSSIYSKTTKIQYQVKNTIPKGWK